MTPLTTKPLASGVRAKVGDRVRTMYTGKPTEHTVTKRFDGIRCETGVALSVTPSPVAGGSLSAAWFDLIED